ncbi:MULTISPECIES: type II toxin-antitoxin system HipA family toxin [unclassified Achromobacter]|uniref:type II toxin-antitoxin system HipA family toxin n=1 Tax=unclassified Achromobacter TaxID=2626865 RepID=UPI000B519127|nr:MULTISPECIES: type II toxin-antitoxin system HipA family toxin [unclassified Achromobacter]OWT80283.1 protein kinase [Achromobacter sp. HZ34]OWT82166.1 protein kinase [Achromobacter sp. HZ28]
MTTSKPIFIYLQRPDNGSWVTIGRYRRGDTGIGLFQYAPSYLDAGLSWSLDPVNLPLAANLEYPATRYGGLHDVLRDACPDAWGRALIQREYGISDSAPQLDYLMLAGNSDRWGAIAVGTAKKAPVAQFSTPPISLIQDLATELQAMQMHRPAVRPELRRKLLATPSMGGARPKAVVREAAKDGGAFWLVKPILASDTQDLPRLEHAMQVWGTLAGLNFAESRLIPQGETSPLSLFLSRRFDRQDGRRLLTLSAASLLQTEYPAQGGGTDQPAWTYPDLAHTLIQIGAHRDDALELFDRMLFNALIGNDDDHPRNHAVVFEASRQRWRIAPAYDVVPNVDFTPDRLAMRMSRGKREISRSAALADWKAFGFSSEAQAKERIDGLVARFVDTYQEIEPMLDDSLRALMSERIAQTRKLLAP